MQPYLGRISLLFGNVRDFRGKLQECLGLNHLWRINWVIDFVKRSAYGIIYDKPAGLGKNIEMGDLRKKSNIVVLLVLLLTLILSGYLASTKLSLRTSSTHDTSIAQASIADNFLKNNGDKTLLKIGQGFYFIRYDREATSTSRNS